MKITVALFTVLLLSNISLAQNTPSTFYAESFRKGPTRIKENKLHLHMTSENPIFRQRLRDSTGVERYELAITPKVSGGEGNDKITSWEVSVRDLRHSIYGDLLRFDNELSEDPKPNLYWLNPAHSAPAPIRAKRIIKVDAFYLEFHVNDFRFSPPDSPYLESMGVEIQGTNTNPRSGIE
jgi:hypothetical protein